VKSDRLLTCLQSIKVTGLPLFYIFWVGRCNPITSLKHGQSQIFMILYYGAPQQHTYFSRNYQCLLQTGGCVALFHEKLLN